MNESRRRDFLKVAGGVAVVSGLAGCASEAQEDEEPPEDEETEPDEPEEDAPPEEEEEEEEEPAADGDGRIRVAHMIPDYPEVDVYVDDTDEPVFDGLGYTDVTDYVDLDGGEYQIRVTAAGARSLVLFDEEVSVPGGDTTAVALDESAEEAEGAEDGGNAEISFQLELFEDDNTPPEETLNDSRLRLIHASPDAPNVDVLVGETPLFEDVGYGEGEYFELPSGSYELDIYPANGEPADDEPGDEDEPGADEEEEDDGFLSLTADGGVDTFQQEEDEEDDPFEEDEEDEEEDDVPEDEEEEEEDDPFEEDEEDDIEDDEDDVPEDDPVFSFDADLEENSVYTAFATGYLDPDAAESENEFEVVIVEDVVDGEVVEVEDDD